MGELTFLLAVEEGAAPRALSSSIDGEGSAVGAVGGGGMEGARETDRDPPALLGSRPLGAEASGCKGCELGPGACGAADVGSEALG